jgi:hypothetical protein
MKRSEILKTYSLTQLALERLCSFYVTQTRTEFTNKICFVIQLDRERKRWLSVGKSSNLQEIHLRSSQGSSEITDPGGDGYRFFVHDLPKINGVKTVALESVEFPGYYISTGSPRLQLFTYPGSFNKGIQSRKSYSLAMPISSPMKLSAIAPSLIG